MRAVVYEKYGPPEVLQIKEFEKPVPKSNEVLIKVYSTAVTVGDVRLRKADPFMARAFNGFFKPKQQILGMNYSGVVEATGQNVNEFKTNDKVYGSTNFAFGTYAEYICVKEDSVITKKPENIDFGQAAALPFGTLTSLYFLRKGKIKNGDKILIYGASGSLGTAAVQLAKYLGAEVSAVCSASNIELVKSLGAGKVIDYTKEDFSEMPDNYEIIYDTVGKIPFLKCMKKLKPKGIYLDAVHIPPVAFYKDIWTAVTSNKKIIGGTFTERKEDLLFLNDLIKKGLHKPVMDKRYPFEQISEAHRYVDMGHKKGNVVVTIVNE